MSRGSLVAGKTLGKRILDVVLGDKPKKLRQEQTVESGWNTENGTK